MTCYHELKRDIFLNTVSMSSGDGYVANSELINFAFAFSLLSFDEYVELHSYSRKLAENKARFGKR